MTVVLPYVKEQAASTFMQFTRITKENGSSYDHRSYEVQRKFKQFPIEAWKRGLNLCSRDTDATL